MIVGLESADEGTVRYRGADITRRTRGRRPPAQRGIQMVFQDPYASLDPRMRVRDVIAEPLAVTRTGRAAERRDRVAELLEPLGLTPAPKSPFPHPFPGRHPPPIRTPPSP